MAKRYALKTKPDKFSEKHGLKSDCADFELCATDGSVIAKNFFSAERTVKYNILEEKIFFSLCNTFVTVSMLELQYQRKRTL